MYLNLHANGFEFKSLPLNRLQSLPKFIIDFHNDLVIVSLTMRSEQKNKEWTHKKPKRFRIGDLMNERTNEWCLQSKF